MKELELLTRLFAGGETSQRAWQDFLEAYSHLFLKIIWDVEKDRDTVMERYLHVCTTFAENNFAILRTFRQKHGTNPPKFTSWLGAVVRNMIIDAYRAVEGRRRIPKALQGGGESDRKVFELYYWRGLSAEEIERMLAGSRNGSRESVAETIERIEAKLLRPPAKPSQEPMTIRVPYDDQMASPNDEPAINEEIIDRWLSSLTTDERLSIQLRFWDDLSTEEIGEILRISSERQVAHLLENALKKIRARAEQDRFS